MRTILSRLAVLPLAAGLAVAAATPASASNCYVEADREVDAGVAGVDVDVWYDPAIENDTEGEQTVVVTVPVVGPTTVGNSMEDNGPGIVESVTGVDVVETVCTL